MPRARENLQWRSGPQYFVLMRATVYLRRQNWCRSRNTHRRVTHGERRIGRTRQWTAPLLLQGVRALVVQHTNTAM